MEPSLLKSLAVKSANDYFTYLEERNRGRVEVGVKDAQLSGELFLLLPMRRLASVDNLFFSLEGREYPAGSIRIESYDREENRLLLYLDTEQQAAFSSCHPKDILLISDLKFLITRYARWMDACGGLIRFKHSAPLFPFSCNFIPGHTPSPEQLGALRTVFSSPLSYVWGAPGTGKTQIVLAYSLLDCFRQERKVLLVAPTNNAVEQSLSGFLSLLRCSFEDEQDFLDASHQVLRLGTPSSSFSGQYPMCCEVSGIASQIRELKARAQALDDCLTLRAFQFKAKLLKTRWLPAVDGLTPKAELLMQARASERPLVYDIETLNGQIAARTDAINDFEKRLGALRKKNASVSGWLDNTFNTLAAERRRKDIEYCRRCIEELQQEIIQTENSLLRKKQELDNLNASAGRVRKQFAASLKKLRNEVSGIPKLASLFTKLSPYNIFRVKDELLSLQQAADSYCERKAYLSEQYAPKSNDELEKMRSAILQQIESLSRRNTSSRIQRSLIIGCTVDCFLNRFTAHNDQCAYIEHPSGDNEESAVYTDYLFHHIFLDEAGYCSLAKVMPLLCFSAPLTLLGDHLQLPPVCEASNEELQTSKWEYITLWAQSAIYLEDLFLLEFRELAGRYFKDAPASFKNIKRSDLTITYRFDKVLARILDQHLYHIGFTGVQGKEAVAIRYLDVPHLPGNQKRSNPGEAHAICKALSLFGNNYAILTPYRNQAGLIRTLLPVLQRDAVFTVHASQGSEWDTVVLSVTDTSNMWFTNSKNPVSKGGKLMNTAISRTKKVLVLVCDVSFWRAQPEQLICSLLDIAEPLAFAGTSLTEVQPDEFDFQMIRDAKQNPDRRTSAAPGEFRVIL